MSGLMQRATVAGSVAVCRVGLFWV